jgi:hypothetical protein
VTPWTTPCASPRSASSRPRPRVSCLVQRVDMRGVVDRSAPADDVHQSARSCHLARAAQRMTRVNAITMKTTVWVLCTAMPMSELRQRREGSASAKVSNRTVCGIAHGSCRW